MLYNSKNWKCHTHSQSRSYTEQIYCLLLIYLKQSKSKIGWTATSHHTVSTSKVSTSDLLYFFEILLDEKSITYYHAATLRPDHPISSLWHCRASAVMRNKLISILHLQIYHPHRRCRFCHHLYSISCAAQHIWTDYWPFLHTKHLPNHSRKNNSLQKNIFASNKQKISKEKDEQKWQKQSPKETGTV